MRLCLQGLRGFLLLYFALGANSAAANRCDDQNPCTNDAWVDRIGCLNTYIEGCQPCTSDSQCIDPDNNLCTGTYYCELSTGVCTKNPATVVSCDESLDTVCSKTQCQPATGQCVAVAAPPGTSCDDNDPCTVNDTCLDGVCAAGTDQCACQSNADCDDDGNPCNGTPHCDKSVLPFVCKTNPATVISCQPSGDPCLLSTCLPQTGLCTLVPTQADCDDKNGCTIDDTCANGVCSGVLDVGPGATCQCATDSDCAAFEDGDACNGTLFCKLSSGTCELNPATVITCPTVDNTACQENVCQKTTGECVLTPKSGTCDDHDPCTVDDQCVAGVCKGAESVGGTAGACECQVDADCPDDGNPCNGVFYCNPQTNACLLNPVTVIEPGLPCNDDVDCPSSFHCSGALSGTDDQGNAVQRLGVCSRCPDGQDTDCEVNRCDPVDGVCKLVARPEGEHCLGDGDPCSVDEKCSGGSCVATLDVGVGKTCECHQDSDCAILEDGDRCNGTLYCDRNTATCKLNPATVVSCPNAFDHACSQNVCDPQTGVCAFTSAPEGTSCDDGDPCTSGDACAAGACVAGADLCACRFDTDCPQDDDACTTDFYCNRSKVPWQCLPLPGSGVRCGDEDPDDCYDAVCQGAGQCAYVARADGTPCDDGSPCTLSSSCQSGACEGESYCGRHGECALDDRGEPVCTCGAGWGGSQCDTPTTTGTPCGDVGQERTCRAGAGPEPLLTFCSADPAAADASLVEVNCGALTGAGSIDGSPAGECRSLGDGEATCLVPLGAPCLLEPQYGHFACGTIDAQGQLQAAVGLGCDERSGCVEGMPSCSESSFSPTCAGSRRLYQCASFGQPLGIDCASTVVGGQGCEGEGVCVGVGVGGFCLPGHFECAAPLVCNERDAVTRAGRCEEVAGTFEICPAPTNWLGDGFCDGVANQAACDWDHGDCCASTCVDATYACGSTAYLCLDPAAPSSGCAAPLAWLGDGYCDATANVAACDWDHGDCCATSCVDAAYSCGSNGFVCSDPAYPADDVGSLCSAPPGWLGDGYCDDTANDEACGWDEGDCCESTCQPGVYACGANGYRCLDPDVDDGTGPAGTGDAGSDDAGGDAGALPEEGMREDAGSDAGTGAVADGGGTEGAVDVVDAGTTTDESSGEGTPGSPEPGSEPDQASSSFVQCGATATSSRGPSAVPLALLGGLLACPARRRRRRRRRRR